MKKKKIIRKFLFGATKEDMKPINSHKKRTGQTETDAIRDLVQGKDRFGPVAESLIAEAMAKTGKGREEIIEAAILRMMEAAKQ